MTRKKLMTIFILIVVSLLVLGIIFQLSLHSPESLLKERSYYARVIKFIIIIGLGIIFIIFNLPSHPIYIKFFPIAFYILNLFALVYVLIKGVKTNGATRWINLGFFSYQPSETAKLALIMIISFIFSFLNYSMIRRKMLRENIKKKLDVKIGKFDYFLVVSKDSKIKFYTFLLISILTLIYAILIYYSRSFSLTVQIILIYIVMIYFSKYINFKYILTIVLSSSIFILFAIKAPYRKLRLSDNDQIKNAIEIIRNGGLFGKGYGNGLGRNFFLQEIQNDFVFAGIAEEWGLILSILLIFLFIVLITIIFYVSSLTTTVYDRMLSLGIAVMITHQVLLHIGINLKLLPTTGVTLPFISYGGSSMLTVMFSMMMIKNIILRIKDDKFKKEDDNNE